MVSAVAKVFGEETRVRLVRTKLKFRKPMPQRVTKHDFENCIV